jgi:hypothetical protein
LNEAEFGIVFGQNDVRVRAHAIVLSDGLLNERVNMLALRPIAARPVCLDVIHGHESVFDGDACTNQAESFLSGLRRMIDGQHHTVSPQYLHQYAAHAAWIEDNRRLDNGVLANRALGLALKEPVSRQWKGYWQRSVISSR